MSEFFDADGLVRVRDNQIFVERETVVGRDYSGVKISQFESHGSTFLGCKFGSMKVDYAIFASGKVKSVYRDCTFDGIRIKRVMGGLVRFENCSFRDVLITGWSLQECDLVDCVFTGKMKAGRYGGSFWGAPPVYWQQFHGKRVNEVKGNDFSRCSIIDMDFRRGVDLRLQKLPQGADYLYVEDGKRAIKRALAALETWESEELRQEAQVHLDLLNVKIQDGQKQIFISNASGYL
ncbi:MAG: hypothetical protein LBU61_06370, partial [Coriobacteriales bacterium]|nr:hypothetical protein [Coriobacteriales bacterium]